MKDDRAELIERLLSEGLDLCVRARKMDAMDRRQAALDASQVPEEWLKSGLFDQYVAEYNKHKPDTPMSTRSGTVAMWLEEQYQADLVDWERRSRSALLRALEAQEGGR